MGCGGSKNAPPPPKMYAFRVKVLGGLNLFNNEFGVQAPGSATSKFKFQAKPNPYVELKCEDQTRSTRIIRWEVNPVWNEEFIFTCNTRKPLLKLRVYDQLVASEAGKALSGQDAIIGESDINLHGLLVKDEREMWVQLKGTRGKGELGILVQECYRTQVQVVAGHDLVAGDKFSKTSDVYMTLQVGQQAQQQTTVKHWTVNPRWTGEIFYFYIPYSNDVHLQCKIWDKDLVGSDEPMGWVNYNMNAKSAQRDPNTKQIKAQTMKLKVRNYGASKGPAGEIELIVGHNDQYMPDCPDPGPVPEAQKETWPPATPQTCTFEVKALGAFNIAAADPQAISNAIDDVANEMMFCKFRQQTGSSDPFLRVECEGVTYDTSKINNTLNPVWNETLQFVCRNKQEAQIRLTLFDHDVLSENDRLGGTQLPASMLRSGERVELWSVLDHNARGEVGLVLTQGFQVKVRVGECFEFPGLDINGMSDPFLKVGIEDAFHQTRVVTDDRNPVYDEDFRWVVNRLGPDVFFKVEAYDSDLSLFGKQVLPELIGTGQIALDNLQRGVANKFTIQLKNKKGENAGRVNVVIVDEMPIPPSAYAQLGAQTKEAVDAVAAKLAAESKAFFKVISPEDPQNNKEAQIEPADPKILPRPRCSRFRVSVLGLRGIKKQAATTVYVAVVVPSQGLVVKTKAVTELKNPDFMEEFCFDVPTRTNGGVQFYVFDGSQVPYTDAWTDDTPKKAMYNIAVPFRTLNKGEGSIRGSQVNDTWLTTDDGSELVVRISEDYRWQVMVKQLNTTGTLSPDKDTDVNVTLTLGDNKLPCHTAVVQKNESLSAMYEYFTVFSQVKNSLKLEVDAGEVGKGSFALQDLKRGIGQEVTIPLSGGAKAGSLVVYIKEEEKMGLLDQLVDVAANAAKLAQKALQDAKEYVTSGKAADDAKDKAKETAAAVTTGITNAGNAAANAIGGLFKK
eukprot:PhF_6_TR37894/c1_g1_i1/m.56570